MRTSTLAILAACTDAIRAFQQPLFRSPALSPPPQLIERPTTADASYTARTDRFTKKKQDNSTCPTYGEKQWTGTINVSKGHDLFYWFFESRGDPDNDPIIIWLSGGPGASSAYGLFDEVGPCQLKPGADRAEPNPWSWNNNASIVFLDQPAGAGLSRLADGMPLIAREEDAAEDFQQFLNVFFTDVFPSRKHLPIHIATESYGGHYGPVYLHHILQSRRYRSETAFWGRLESLILIDAVIDFTGPFFGMYELFCDNEKEETRALNATACEQMAVALPELQRLGDSCQSAYRESAECRALWDFALDKIHAAYRAEVMAGRRHPQNLHMKCNTTGSWLNCEDQSKGNITSFMNQDWVKLALDKDPSFKFDAMGRRFFASFMSQGAMFKPTTRELVDVLEEHAADNSVADVKLLVINGNLDPFITTPGTKWTYERLRWSEQADYTVRKWQPLPDGLAATGEWKATRSGRLAMVTLDGAGHMAPGDVREGSFRVLQRWFDGNWRG